jgi:hypothetical protein
MGHVFLIAFQEVKVEEKNETKQTIMKACHIYFGLMAIRSRPVL